MKNLVSTDVSAPPSTANSNMEPARGGFFGPNLVDGMECHWGRIGRVRIEVQNTMHEMDPGMTLPYWRLKPCCVYDFHFKS
jgi:hypothetical protein